MTHMLRSRNGARYRSIAAAGITLLSLSTHAQTYYYIDHITVSPASPTTSDAITITIDGSLSNTAAFVASTNWAINGNTVQLSVDAAFQGIGLDVLVPHSEDFSIGMLPAGPYTITIGGTAIQDLAPTPEHAFVVSGGSQPACDSLAIISVRWGAFGTDRLMVTATNGSSNPFVYPGFVMLDAMGDTLAKETVFYFGIGTSPQEHLLDVMPGAVIDGNTIDGQLHLWSGFYTTPECQWSGPWELCPGSECTPLVPFLVNFGNSLVEAEVPYTIEDADGASVGGGTFVLTSTMQSDYQYDAGICLPVGTYSLQLDQVGNVGGQLSYGISTNALNMETVMAEYVQGTFDNVLSFDLYGPCIDGPNGVVEPVQATGLEVRTDGDRLFIVAQEGITIGQFWIMDVRGRILRSGIMKADRGSIALDGWSAGIYLVRSASFPTQRFMR